MADASISNDLFILQELVIVIIGIVVSEGSTGLVAISVRTGKNMMLCIQRDEFARGLHVHSRSVCFAGVDTNKNRR